MIENGGRNRPKVSLPLLEANMNNESNNKNDDELEETKIPYLQELYDRPILLLVAGLVVMFGFYTIWGVIEVLSLPKAPLP